MLNVNRYLSRYAEGCVPVFEEGTTFKVIVPLIKQFSHLTPEVRLLQVLKGEMNRRELQEALGLKDDEHFRKQYLLPSLESGLIEMTIPDKPRSSKQKYRATLEGQQLLNKE